ncbi:tetratricopeptide repeat protein [Dactylosporangium sp. NPDC051485]|uniref:tetratricopeptide repeat protein n=1 Tax=Dactylosporangium sp. NPDC051485 TaxID=3154846 RepID=UPI003420184F
MTLPDPGTARTLDDLIDRLRRLKVWAGDPSYDTVKERINAAWTAAGRPAAELTGKTTVADCFRTGRRRLNPDLVVAVVTALLPDPGYVAQWHQALRVVTGETRAGAQVRVSAALPPDPDGFVGRDAQLRRIRAAAGCGGTVVITGMPGVGKTQLAVRAAHLLHGSSPYTGVLFVNLRGHHPDPAQPPADPAAVLDGFLRLLGAAGQQIPHDLQARAAAWRERLAGTRTLVVLDDAADAGQVRPLLPDAPGCTVLVTGRRSLADLPATEHVDLDGFSRDEAVALLTRAVPHVAAGADPGAAGRIADSCGGLPLALGLLAAHIRARPGWTLTDHAARLDERHRGGRLDRGVELALDLSYRRATPARQRMLRLVALHPGQDFDAHAAAALAGVSRPAAQAHLAQLCRDNLLQRGPAGRYTLHDLVRAYAADRAADEDPPAQRRAALTRLFDGYLAGASAAMDALYPVETPRYPRTAEPAAARRWLDTERPVLVAVAAHAAAHGWPRHATRLSGILFRYLGAAHPGDALTVHAHALDAARGGADRVAEAHALISVGITHLQLGRPGEAAERLGEALRLFRAAGDLDGEARALINLGVVEARQGRNRSAAGRHARAAELFGRGGHRTGEANALVNLGDAEGRLGRHGPAIEHLRQALDIFRGAGDRTGEAWALNGLGEAELRTGRHAAAAGHLREALELYRTLGNEVGEAWALDNLGALDTRLGRPATHHQRALAIFRAAGERGGEASALNGLGEAATAAGDPAGALACHAAAHAVAVDIGAREQQARAHLGLAGHDPDPALARAHLQQALRLYRDLEMPEADRVSARISAPD